jgi:hypothetical protein
MRDEELNHRPSARSGASLASISGLSNWFKDVRNLIALAGRSFAPPPMRALARRKVEFLGAVDIADECKPNVTEPTESALRAAYIQRSVAVPVTRVGKAVGTGEGGLWRMKRQTPEVNAVFARAPRSLLNLASRPGNTIAPSYGSETVLSRRMPGVAPTVVPMISAALQQAEASRMQAVSLAPPGAGPVSRTDTESSMEPSPAWAVRADGQESFAAKPTRPLSHFSSPTGKVGWTEGADAPYQPRALEPGSSQFNPAAAASTLHLDGAALGRWAIEHLERSLARPPSGMTGIDPRISIPRSRVAPF